MSDHAITRPTATLYTVFEGTLHTLDVIQTAKEYRVEPGARAGRAFSYKMRFGLSEYPTSAADAWKRSLAEGQQVIMAARDRIVTAEAQVALAQQIIEILERQS